MNKLSDYDGKYINTDGYAYGEIPNLLKDRFNEDVVKIVDEKCNIGYFTASGYHVSSNGYCYKMHCRYESVLHGCNNPKISDCMCYAPQTCNGYND